MCRCSHRPGRSEDPADGPLARVDLINPVSRSTALNAAEMSVNQPNSTWSFPKLSADFQGFCRLRGAMRYRLPCRRSRVRVPSAAYRKAPLTRGFFLGCTRDAARLATAFPALTTRSLRELASRRPPAQAAWLLAAPRQTSTRGLATSGALTTIGTTTPCLGAECGAIWSRTPGCLTVVYRPGPQ